MRVDDVFPEHPPGRYHVTVAEDGRQTWVRLRERGRPKEEGSHVLDELFSPTFSMR